MCKYHSDMCKINVLYVTREAVEAAAAVEANSKTSGAAHVKEWSPRTALG